MAAVGSTASQRSARYRRRRPLPAVLIIVALVGAAVLVWTAVLNEPDQAAAVSCPPPPSGQPAGQLVGPQGLDQVTPVPAQQGQVRVLNANGKRGQAGAVSSQLVELGFLVGGEATNDPIYPNFGLTCHGQIRFGAAGSAAARTLSIVVPCAELVRDARPDPSVDLALGSEFDELTPGPEARDVLEQLSRIGAPPPPALDGAPAAAPAPPVDPQLIQSARQTDC